jgi:predicted ATPase
MQGSARAAGSPDGRNGTLTRIRLDRFTAFERLDLELTPGINVFIGANGTGKTHLLKVAYAACDAAKTGMNVAEKLTRIFLPSGRAIGRLVKRQQGSVRGAVDVWRGERKLRVSFSNHATTPSTANVTGQAQWSEDAVESVFIPVKEMLSNGPGFRSLYAQRDIHFEEIYADVLDRAYRPALRGAVESSRKRVLKTLQEAVEGKVTVRNEEFFLRNRHGNLEFTLLAEGMRKLGLLWLLVQNGTLLNGSVLFWDEPETNLNPKVFAVVIEILLQLQRMGVQVLIATHDYAILKELELLMRPDDRVRFCTLYRDESDGELTCETAGLPFELDHSPIAEAFTSLYDRAVARSLGRNGRR